jgi:hypothetical protein
MQRLLGTAEMERQRMGNIRLQLEVAMEVIHRLEMAGDRRTLVRHEESLRKMLKCKSLGLESL